MVTTEIIDVTPRMASEWLDIQTTNRNINQKKVRQYAADLSDGKFALTGDSIKLNCNGAVLDGQHRLRAIVESGKPLTCVVVRGLKFEDVFDKLDGHRPRSLQDVLTIMGESNHRALSACVVACYWFDATGVPYAGAGGATHRYVEYFNTHRAEMIAAATLITNTSKKATAIGVRPTYIGLAYVVFGRISQDDRDEFLERLLSGANLAETSPIYRLRERMMKNKQASVTRLGRRAEAALLFKAWNHWRAGNEVRQLVWRPENEPYPVPE